jgi:hypothetical protein
MHGFSPQRFQPASRAPITAAPSLPPYGGMSHGGVFDTTAPITVVLSLCTTPITPISSPRTNQTQARGTAATPSYLPHEIDQSARSAAQMPQDSREVELPQGPRPSQPRAHRGPAFLAHVVPPAPRRPGPARPPLSIGRPESQAGRLWDDDKPMPPRPLPRPPLRLSQVGVRPRVFSTLGFGHLSSQRIFRLTCLSGGAAGRSSRRGDAGGAARGVGIVVEIVVPG